MNTCTFFGHSDTPEAVIPLLRKAVIDLIENQKADTFYVGTHGAFDRHTCCVLREIKKFYPHIDYQIVLAYMPKHTDKDFPYEINETLLPDGIETVPPRFAINYCNKWMIQRSKFVITYVTHDWGGAARFKSIAVKQGKAVIELSKQKSLR